jgi:AraC-like DNA-binding protein
MYQITHLKGPHELELKTATFRRVAFPPHFHETCSIGLIRSGMEQVICNGRVNIVHANRIVVFNPGELHSNRYHDDDEWSYTSVYVDPDYIVHIASSHGIRSDAPLRFTNIIEDPALSGPMVSLNHDDVALQTEIVERVLLGLLTKHLCADNEAGTAYMDFYEIVEEVKRFIGMDLYLSHSLSRLSQRHGISPFQLHRAFKAHTGLTTSGYRTLLRINLSKKLMHSGVPLTEVALECGFFDQSHFIRRFKAFTGVTPGAYLDSMTSV